MTLKPTCSVRRRSPATATTESAVVNMRSQMMVGSIGITDRRATRTHKYKPQVSACPTNVNEIAREDTNSEDSLNGGYA